MSTPKLFDVSTLRKPDYYPAASRFIDALHSSFWTSLKWTFQSAAADYRQSLTQEQRALVARSLSCIAQVELPVKSFWAKIGDSLQHPSIKDLGIVIANSEIIHSNTYSKLLDVLDMNAIYEENLKVPVVARRLAYLTKYSERRFKDNKKQFVYALCLFSVFSENVSLFSQFYTLASIIREHNVLKELEAALSYTSAEETSHYLVGKWIINTLQQEYPELFDQELLDRIKEETDEAYKAECQLVDWILQGYKGERLEPTLLKLWIHSRFKEGLVGIGVDWGGEYTDEEKEYLKTTSWFDDFVYGQRQTDFFVVKPTEYSVAAKSFAEDDVFA